MSTEKLSDKLIRKVSALLGAAYPAGMAWGSAAANGTVDTSMKNGELECDVHDLHGKHLGNKMGL